MPCGSLRSTLLVAACVTPQQGPYRRNRATTAVTGLLPPPLLRLARRVPWQCAGLRGGRSTGADLGVIRLEAEEGGDLSRGLGVVLLVDGQLVDADERDDLRPARARHGADGRNAAGDVVEVQVERRRQQLVRRLDQLRRQAASGASGIDTQRGQGG